jgi:hypothetical protein
LSASDTTGGETDREISIPEGHGFQDIKGPDLKTGFQTGTMERPFLWIHWNRISIGTEGNKENEGKRNALDSSSFFVTFVSFCSKMNLGKHRGSPVPEGCQPHTNYATRCYPSGMKTPRPVLSGGIADARPPANGCEASSFNKCCPT